MPKRLRHGKKIENEEKDKNILMGISKEKNNKRSKVKMRERDGKNKKLKTRQCTMKNRHEIKKKENKRKRKIVDIKLIKINMRNLRRKY